MSVIFAIHYCIVYLLCFSQIIVLVDVRVCFEQVQVIKCNIKLELAEISRDVENESISRKKQGNKLMLSFSNAAMFS
jgi:hypothetical protein